METNNSFKQLGKEEEEMYPHPPPETEMGIMGNVRVFNFMSNVLELYLPKVFEVFISLVGGASESEQKGSFPKGNADDQTDDISGGKPRE